MKFKIYFMILGLLVALSFMLFLFPSIIALDLTDNLISYWKLDDTDDTNVLDAHGGNGGTQDGTLDEETGKIGTSFAFGGDGDNVDLGDVSEVEGIGAFSVSLWAKVPGASVSQTRYMVTKRGDGGRVFYLHARDNENVYFEVHNDSTGEGVAFVTDPFDNVADTWVHIVGVYNGTNVMVYANAVVGGTVGTLSGNTDSSTDPMVIGAENTAGQNSWLGHVDEVAIWSKALTQTDIDALYNSGNALSYDSFDGEPPEDCWTEETWGIFIPKGCVYEINSGEVG